MTETRNGSGVIATARAHRRHGDHPNEKALVCLIDGETDAHSRGALEAHVKSCARCQDRRKELEWAMSRYVELEGELARLDKARRQRGECATELSVSLLAKLFLERLGSNSEAARTIEVRRCHDVRRSA
jgi:anti-sigma factor RsiW